MQEKKKRTKQTNRLTIQAEILVMSETHEVFQQANHLCHLTKDQDSMTVTFQPEDAKLETKSKGEEQRGIHTSAKDCQGQLVCPSRVKESHHQGCEYQTWRS
jgi:hypothetical protein